MDGSGYLLALLLGVIAGLRTFTAPAVVAWAAHFGRLDSTGTLSGAAIGVSAGEALDGAIARLVGAIVGALGGVRARSGLAHALRDDHPAGVIEDAVATVGAVLIGIFAP